MTSRTTALAAALSLLPLGQPLLLGSMATAAAVRSNQAVHAQSAEDYLDAGIEKGKSGELKEAIKDFNKAIEIDPQNADTYFFRALAKDGLKDYQGAIADFNKVIAINPQYHHAYARRGLAKYFSSRDLKGMCLDFKTGASLGNVHAQEGLNMFCRQ